MATLDYYTVASITKGRIFSASRANTWNGSAMTAHASVSTYGTDGVLTPSSASDPAGTTPQTKYTFTIPSGLPDGDYLLAAFEVTPVIGAYSAVEPGLLAFNFHDGAVTTLEAMQDAIDAGGGGGGGDVTQGEFDALAAEVEAIQTALLLPSDGHILKAALETHQHCTFEFTFEDAQNVESDNFAFVCYELGDDENLFELTTISGITAVWDDTKTTITVTGTTSNTETAGQFNYNLRNTTAGRVRARGSLYVLRENAPSA